MADWNDKARPTPLADFLKVRELTKKYGGPANVIHVEVEAAPEVEALFRAMDNDDLEAAAIHRRAAFDKLAVIRGPEWAKWAAVGKAIKYHTDVDITQRV